MASTIKNTQTERMLMTAFAGESQARNRYTFFASAAKKEGYQQIAAVFLETAEQEKEHAKLFFKQLQGGNVQITACFPAGVIGSTLENLHAAAAGEHEEWQSAYPAAARTAKDEGFEDIADLFLRIASIEAYHERRFARFLASIDGGMVFSRTTEIQWQCRNCGYIHKGKDAPHACPACSHPQGYFEALLCE